LIVELRDYHQNDWTRVCSIHDQARPIELAGSCDPRAFVPLAEDRDDLEQFQACRKLVACVNDIIVGFVGINDSEVGWLYVDPEISRNGVGRQLLRRCLAEISGAACVFVLDGNKPAIHLYQSEGFAVVNSFKSKNNGYPCTVLELSQ
jgi:ribosomal protein S18 acetylase RimI-like enzyme